ncbi:hypothetical protein K469DRAFT_646988 [Zopfia rhizophila CBS 207.26]|uniref:HNH domain-containing protein n=1 Tax=Zopfia rhizophila CBS 207.26 TaxID=1314779 RepID=A0A6A6DCB0_9PEZI|nr:hypothetical protein K469DRAFT_646988 [Zopfia rhizophila CBS 207.26]
MADGIPAEEQSNYETFRECLSEPVLKALAAPVEKPKKKRAHRKRKSKDGVKLKGSVNYKKDEKAMEEEGANDAEDLGEFIDYLSSLIFPSLPATLRTLSHFKFKASALLQDLYSTPLSLSTESSLFATLPPTALDSLESYSLLPSNSEYNDLHNWFTPVLSSYITSVTAPPPPWSSTRTTECELCHRSWIPLTYHHLIPKSTHERVSKRGWHAEDKLNSVAWLCRACHSFVHRVESNEELARYWYSVELLESREDVQQWVKWVGRVRWKKR